MSGWWPALAHAVFTGSRFYVLMEDDSKLFFMINTCSGYFVVLPISTNIMRQQLRDEILPMLNSGQSWCCDKGCGTCLPMQIDFEYSRTEDLDGNLLESKTHKAWVSDCCKADLLQWDESKNEFVPWDSSQGEDAPQ